MRKRKQPKDLYNGHKSRAAKRGIEFLLTFEEWIGIWSLALGPDWANRRGWGTDKFCMARFGDKGPYSIDNVKIITNAQNASEIDWGDEKRREQSERMKLRMADPETRRKCSVAKLGKPGNPQTEASKKKISVAHLGKSSINKSISKLGEKNPIFGWKWFHKGKAERLHDPSQVPKGWKLGRLKK